MFISFHLPKAFQTEENVRYLRSWTASTLPCLVFLQNQEQNQRRAANFFPYHPEHVFIIPRQVRSPGKSGDALHVRDFYSVISMTDTPAPEHRSFIPVEFNHLERSSCSEHLDKSWPISTLHRRFWRTLLVLVENWRCFPYKRHILEAALLFFRHT